MSRSQYVEIIGAGLGDAARLGGKGASLCRLAHLGHRVPPGLVVSREAFQSTLEDIGLASALESLSELLSASKDCALAAAQIQQYILAGRIPPRVLNPIIEAVAALRLWASGDGVIVRSSATVEDGSAHSFAGIFESTSIDTPEALEPAIREIWASAFSPRASTYFREIGLRQLPEMAVVVQRFLRAERSGVMFTRFAGPDGRPRILVEHVEGGCEKLVRGEVTPERLWLDEPEQVPELLEGPLAAAHARTLAALAKRLEESLGTPQDVEWLIHGDAVHIVQSRPITAPISSAPESR